MSMVMTMLEIYERRLKEGSLREDAAQRAVLPELERIRFGLCQPAQRRIFRKTFENVAGLYMWGGVGRGKSMLMDLLFDTVGVAKKRYHFHAFMQLVHREMTEARKRGVDDAILPVAQTLAQDLRFLAFDEMQVTDITDAMLVGRLFEALFERGVTIVTTSNRPPHDLYKDGLNRQLFVPFIDLISEKLVCLELRSPVDYRQGRIAGSQTYFISHKGDKNEEFEALWRELTQAECTPLTITVQKRDVTLPLFCNGHGRASFNDLCAKPLGAADYLALTQFVRVLFVSDIPQLSQDNFNEAKRFVTLVDTLYEAKIQLICTASAEPEALYKSGRGTFEFERTASRLREMQSTDWAQQG